MTHIQAVNTNKVNNGVSSYNAVKIQINDPKTNIPEGLKLDDTNNGIYNAVNIEVNRPTVNVMTKPIYNYPKSNTITTADMAGILPINIPNMPAIPVAYQTNLINNRNFVSAKIDFETKEDVTPEKKSEVPAPSLTTVDAEKVSFKGQPKTEPITKIDIKTTIANLSSKDYDKQAQSMEEITRTAMTKPEVATEYLVTEIFNELINITNVDTSNLETPSKKQIEIRKQIIINELIKEEAAKNNEDPKKVELPFILTKEEMLEAAKLSPMEQAERNKEYSLYTMAVLSKIYTDEVEKTSGNIVPLTDLPGISTIVDTLRNSENPSIKIAAIDSLRYISRKEYNEELASIFGIVANDKNPVVAQTAKTALDFVK